MIFSQFWLLAVSKRGGRFSLNAASSSAVSDVQSSDLWSRIGAAIHRVNSSIDSTAANTSVGIGTPKRASSASATLIACNESPPSEPKLRAASLRTRRAPSRTLRSHPPIEDRRSGRFHVWSCQHQATPSQHGRFSDWASAAGAQARRFLAEPCSAADAGPAP